MDLNDFNLAADAERGFEFELLNPQTRAVLKDDEGNPYKWRVQGIDSPAFKAHSAAMAERRQNQRTRKLSVAERERENIESYVLLTLGWSGNLLFKGENPPFSKEKAREIITAQGWIGEQIDEVVGERSNFLQK